MEEPQSPRPGPKICASGGRLPSSHHQCTGKTHRNHVKFTLMEDVGMKSARAQDDLQITHESFFFLRSAPNFHDVDGACLWRSVMRKVKKRLPSIDPNDKWLEQIQLGSNRVRFESCWYKSDDSTPAYIHATYSRPCSRPTAWVDECTLSLMFPAVPRHNSVGWSDCRRIRQERRQTSVLLLRRASPAKQSSI